jgi:hypothetical protein
MAQVTNSKDQLQSLSQKFGTKMLIQKANRNADSPLCLAFGRFPKNPDREFPNFAEWLFKIQIHCMGKRSK